MAEKRKVDFCIGCRKNTEYEIQKGIYKETIRDREYEFVLTEAICKECGEKMHIPGLIDANIREREEQYYGSCCKISGKMQAGIAYILEKKQEVTPLALQKLLYYIQGIYMALFDREFFRRTAVHGSMGRYMRRYIFFSAILSIVRSKMQD